MRRKSAEKRKSEQIVFRCDPQTRRSLDDCCDRLGEEYSASDVLRRVVEMLLAEGVDVAVNRVKEGAWAPVPDRREELRIVVDETLERTLMMFARGRGGGLALDLARRIRAARAEAEASAADEAGQDAQKKHAGKQGRKKPAG